MHTRLHFHDFAPGPAFLPRTVALVGLMALAGCQRPPGVATAADPRPSQGAPATAAASVPPPPPVTAAPAPPARPEPPAPPAVPAPPSTAGTAGAGEPCPDGVACAPGLRCVRYYGIAGPRGPQFTSCEIPCLPGRSKCPAGQACVTIADGPGSVCRGR